jgi:flagellar biosynthesis/type III secretory pathway protein FliH
MRSLSDNDCVLETELGSTNFGLDTQLKEVEQGSSICLHCGRCR